MSSRGMDSTADSSGEYLRERDRFGSPTPGVALVVEAGQPAARGVVLQQQGLEIGRGSPDGILTDDEQVSRTHLRVSYAEGTWTFEDLGSRNGTFIDGVRLTGSVKVQGSPLVRIGRSLLWAVPDVRPYRGHAMLGV